MFRRTLFLVILSVFSTGASAEEATQANEWAHESQAAVVKTSGNSETESYSLKHGSAYTKNKDTGKVGASYLKTAGENTTTGKTEETARKWDASARYERALSDKWSGFLGYLVESDKYAGYQQKHNTDLGGKYFFAKEEKYDVIGEAGYRYVHQNNMDSTQDHYSAARAYLEGNYRLNPTNSMKLWVEYIPNFDDSEDYQTNAEASLASTLSTMFSLKVGYLVKTDNKPATATAKKTDTTLTTALVAKF